MYYNSEKKPFDKYDLKQILSDIDALEKLGVPCERIDTAKMTEDEVTSAYFEATFPSVYKKYRIRQIFGSRRSSGWLFGKQVPALLVFGDGDKYPTDVYPHEEMGKEVTIEEYMRVARQEALK